MTALFDLVGSLLPSLAGKSSVLILAAAGAALAMRRFSAASKYMLWTATLGAVLVLPFAAAVLPTVRLPILPAQPGITVVAPPPISAPRSSQRSTSVSRQAAAPPAPMIPGADPTAIESGDDPTPFVSRDAATPPRHRWPPVATLVAVLWLIGVGGLLARLVAGTAGIHQLTRSSVASTDARVLARVRMIAERLGIARRVTIRVARRDCIPATWGMLFPTLLLPAVAERWDQERLDAVLLHELGHVARFDALTQMIARLAGTLFWFNPLVWFAVGQARIERERACDDLVLAEGTRASRYANDLLTLVLSLEPPRQVAYAALAMARRSDIEGRVLAILDPKQPRSSPRGLRSLAFIGPAALIAVAIGAVAPARRSQRPAPLPPGTSVPRVTNLAAIVANTVAPRSQEVERGTDSVPAAPQPLSARRAPLDSFANVQGVSLPPIRQLGPIVATARDSFNNVLGGTVLQRSDGKVLVVDTKQKRVVLLDSTLQTSKVVIDSTGAAPRLWARGVYGPYRFRGDSTMFADLGAAAMLVMDPGGMIARVFAPPAGASLTRSLPRADGVGGMLFSASTPFPRPFSAVDSALGAGGHIIPDSTAVLRYNIVVNRLDTLAYIRESGDYLGTPATDSCGQPYTKRLYSAFPAADGWALLSDGTVAVVREHDLHIDWIALDGTRSASPKLPHEWHRLTDSDKVVIIDSLRSHGFMPSAGGGVFSGGRVPPAGTSACEKAHILAQRPDFAAPESMPDYEAPFNPNAILADADDNLWIQTVPAKYPGTGPAYMVVNRKGEVIDQVQIPGGTSIVSFGPGVVYLVGRVGANLQLVRARIR